MKSIAQKAVVGVRWSAISQFGRQSILFISTGVLARLLLPQDFGLMGMVLVITGFAAIFKDLGTSSAIIQKSELSESLLSSIFWINIFIGIIVTLSVALLAPLAGSYFNEPRIIPLLRCLSVSFTISSLGTVHQSLLQREMKFNILARIELISTLVSAIVGIGAAYLNFGVWSLVFQTISLMITSLIGLWISSLWRPYFVFDVTGVKSIASFSGYLILYSTFNYFARNADNTLIGKYLGPLILGYYALSYRMMQYPLQSVSGLYGRVLFPLFSKLQNNNEAFRDAYLKTLGFIAIITFPLMLTLAVLARPIIYVFLSEKWLPIVLPVQILCIVGMNQSLATTVGNIYIAKGKTKMMFYIGLISSVCYVISIIIGLRWGMMGVVICYAVVDILLTLPNYIVPFKYIELPVIRICEQIWRPLVCSLVMAVSIYFVADSILYFTDKVFGTIILILLSVIIYLVMSWIYNRIQLYSFMKIAMSRN